MLNFHGITKIFKSDLLSQPFVALDDVSFDIPGGAMVGFLGANGAGKTTSIKIIMDFIRPDKGHVTFSKDLGEDKIKVFRNIGFLPERPYFYQNLTGMEFLFFMGALSELSRAHIQQEIKFWGPRFKIDHALKRELKTYSKGMLQRIGFLATILHGPELIILDEPLSGLDPIGRKELKDVIVEVHRKGKTVFFSSHIVPDIEEICDRVVFLKEGKLVYSGQVDTLLKSNEELEYIVKVKSENLFPLSTQIVKRENYPGNLVMLTVKENLRVHLLDELIKTKVDIVGLEQVRPSLEEIFYKTRSAHAQPQ